MLAKVRPSHRPQARLFVTEMEKIDLMSKDTFFEEEDLGPGKRECGL